MTDRIRRVDYFHVEVPDTPGEGAKVLRALREYGVSLLSMTAFPRGQGTAQIDLVAGTGDLEKAAAKAGIRLSARRKAFFVSGADRPGAVAETFEKLAAAKVNVTAANAACGQTGFGMILWVKPADYDSAAKVLGV
jgi:hypothetical protein